MSMNLVIVMVVGCSSPRCCKASRRAFGNKARDSSVLGFPPKSTKTVESFAEGMIICDESSPNFFRTDFKASSSWALASSRFS